MLSRVSLFRRRHLLVVTAHLLLVPLGYYLAFLLRFDLDPHLGGGRYWLVFLESLPIVVAIRMACFGVFRVYRGAWRYAGLSDLNALGRAVTLSSVVSMGVLYFSGLLHGYPRSVVFLDWAVAMLLLGGMRMSVRVLRHERAYLLGRLRGTRGRQANVVRAVVIGAGNAAERLVRELQHDQSAAVEPVAMVDDDPKKQGVSVHGVPVVGMIADVGRAARRYDAKRAIIAIPSATREQMVRVVDLCRAEKVACQIVPSLPELLSGRAQLSQLREVQVEDLLGRGAVELDLSGARERLAGKTVMVTGGAGSIGSELARQVAALGPARLVLVDQAESPLYFVHIEIAKAYPGLDVVPVIADVADRGRMADVFAAHRPHVVLHAAAYKHVPLMEHNVVEAIRNNVAGTLCVAENAARHGAEEFVLISTDKAVRPSSVMGATKRIAERIVLGWPSLVASKTDFRAVRFGNVLGSAGSVIPLFKQQLAEGGPLTVTHPEVTRYFMTIPEAAQLVLMAATLPEAAGRISMLEMGEPVKIRDLAEKLIQLSGMTAGAGGVDIQFTGLRPGEKLYEELMTDVEATVPTALQKIRVVQTDEADGAAVKTGVAELLTHSAVGNVSRILAAVGALVPEAVSPLRERVRSAGGGVRQPVQATLFPQAEERPAGGRRRPERAAS